MRSAECQIASRNYFGATKCFNYLEYCLVFSSIKTLAILVSNSRTRELMRDYIGSERTSSDRIEQWRERCGRCEARKKTERDQPGGCQYEYVVEWTSSALGCCKPCRNEAKPLACLHAVLWQVFGRCWYRHKYLLARLIQAELAVWPKRLRLGPSDGPSS